MDEVWRSEDAMGSISRVHTKRLWANHVSLLRWKRMCTRGQRTLIYTTAAPAKETGLRDVKVNNPSGLWARTYRMGLDRIPGVPRHWDGEWHILISSFSSSPGLGSSSRLGSLRVEASLLWGQGSWQLRSWGLFEWRVSSRDCGLCSIVSWSGLLVSWITWLI